MSCTVHSPGFERVRLAPHEARRVCFSVPQSELAYFDGQVRACTLRNPACPRIASLVTPPDVLEQSRVGFDPAGIPAQPRSNRAKRARVVA